MLSELGSVKTLRKRNKIFALDDGYAASYFRYRGVAPLPVNVSSAVQTLDFHVGDHLQKDVPEQIILFMRTDRSVEAGLQVNGIDAEPLGAEYITLYEADINLRYK